MELSKKRRIRESIVQEVEKESKTKREINQFKKISQNKQVNSHNNNSLINQDFLRKRKNQKLNEN